MPGREALRLAGIEPLSLASKEGISLVNGTQAMLAVGCLELAAAEVLIDTAEVVCAMTLDALRGTPRAFDPRLHAIRPRIPASGPARNTCCACSTGAKSALPTFPAGAYRTAYSLRCAPQGMARCATRSPRPGAYFSIETQFRHRQSAGLRREVLSGGNFHGEPLAFQLDYLAIRAQRAFRYLERRIDRLVNPALNEDLPPFLARHPGSSPAS